MISEADKNLWLVALRSGEYKQTSDVFSTASGERCALGVLADVVAKRDNIELADACDMYCLNWGSRSLPASFLADIFDLNDSGATFPQIADFIEPTLLTKAEAKDLVASTAAA